MDAMSKAAAVLARQLPEAQVATLDELFAPKKEAGLKTFTASLLSRDAEWGAEWAAKRFQEAHGLQPQAYSISMNHARPLDLRIDLWTR